MLQVRDVAKSMRVALPRDMSQTTVCPPSQTLDAQGSETAEKPSGLSSVLSNELKLISTASRNFCTVSTCFPFELVGHIATSL